ncbi:MAG: FAD:protein FMN transferase [Chitinophagales bacterium]
MKIKPLFFSLLLFCTFFSCKQNSDPKAERLQNTVKFQGKTMGTFYSIIYIDAQKQNHQASIDSLFEAFDFSASTYNPKSVISRFNQNKNQDTIEVDATFAAIFEQAKEIYQQTNGYFNPTVMPLVNYWGFGPNKTKPDLDSTRVDSLKQLVNFEALSIFKKEKKHFVVRQQKGIELDFNAIAKGYGVDLVGDFLTAKGLTDYFVEVGGEVVARGKNSRGEWWTVGINKPVENAASREIEEVIQLENQAIATSGNYLQFYEKDGQKFVHTISPQTGYTVPSSLLSASIIAKDCSTADAIATACMVMGFEAAKGFIEGQKDLKALLIYSNERGEMSDLLIGYEAN